MNSKANRLIAFLMALLMMLDMLPASALASSVSPEEAPAETVTVEAVPSDGEEPGQLPATPGEQTVQEEPEAGPARIEVPSDSAQFGLPLEQLQRNQYVYQLPEEGDVLVSTILEELGIVSDASFEASVDEKYAGSVQVTDNLRVTAYEPFEGIAMSVREDGGKTYKILLSYDGAAKQRGPLEAAIGPADEAAVEAAAAALGLQRAEMPVMRRGMKAAGAGSAAQAYIRMDYFGLDLSVDEDQAIRDENGLFEVAVSFDAPRAMVETEGMAVDAVSAQLYHVKDGAAVQVEGARFDFDDDGRMTGFTFMTDSCSPYIVAYTVEFHYEGRTFALTVPGAKDIALSEILTSLEIVGEEGFESFRTGIKSVAVSDERVFRLTEGEDGWLIRVLRESEKQETLSIAMQDGTVYDITVAATGITEIATDDHAAVISTVNSMYLPEEANATASFRTEEESTEAISAVRSLLPGTEKEVTCQVFTVGLENVDAKDYEGFEVAVNLDTAIAGKDFHLFELQDGEAKDITDSMLLNGEENEDGTRSVSNISFTTKDFADYVLCYTLETYYTTFDGLTFRITLNYGPEAEIPEGAELKVKEILADDEEFKSYYDQAMRSIDQPDGSDEESDTDAPRDRYARFFDIEIWSGDRQIEPKAKVQVSISLADLPETDSDEIKVVHFGQSGPVIVESATVEESDVCFSADSFSVYGVIAVPDGEPQGVADLGGRTFKISQNNRYMTSEVVQQTNVKTFRNTSSEDEAGVWQFEETYEEGKYYIFTQDSEGKKQYLTLHTHGSVTSFGDAYLSSTPQAFTVSQNNGYYNISTELSFEDNTGTFYLTEIADYLGFDGSPQESANRNLNLTFTQPQIQSDKPYILVVKYGGLYYVVLNDGTLVKANSPVNGVIKIDDPMVWNYTGDNLYHKTKETGFHGNQLASDYFYRYIDPDVEVGYTDEDYDSTTGHLLNDATAYRIDTRPLMDEIKINYEDNRISSQNNSEHYIGVVKGEKDLHIVGRQPAEDAAEIYFVEMTNLSNLVNENNSTDDIHHTVNHIDISVVGHAAFSIPLAYGTYYYKDSGGQVRQLNVSKESPVTVDLAKDIPIDRDDVKRANITAFTKGANGERNILDDAFIITGYSGNDTNDQSSNQTRIEGAFKVADVKPIDRSNPQEWNSGANRPTDAILAERLRNRIYYTVTVSKKVPFDFEYNGFKLYSTAADAADQAETGVASGSVTVRLSQTFDYWDPTNECPPIGWDRTYWVRGGIIMAGDIEVGSGMDFALSTLASDKPGVKAIEITKFVVDTAGNPITPMMDVENVFHIYRSGSAAASEVVGMDVDTYQQGQDQYNYSNNGYVHVDDKSIIVSEGGIGTVYDYDIDEGMIYIVEDTDEQYLPRSIEDNNGRTWNYKSTRLETEYVWRDDGIEYRRHVSKDYELDDLIYRSIPDALGNYLDINDHTQYNGFLEFYVYNVYEADLIDVSVRKNWLHENGSVAEAPDNSSITVNLGRYKMVEDTDNPVSGTLIISHTVTENGQQMSEEAKSAYHATYIVRHGNSILRSGTYDPDGPVQTLAGLPEGSYTLQVSESVNGFSASTDITSTTVSITKGQETYVNIQTDLTRTQPQSMVTVYMTNTANGESQPHQSHTYSFPGGSTIVFTIYRPAGKYLQNDWGYQAAWARVNGTNLPDPPVSNPGAWVYADHAWEYTLPASGDVTLNFTHSGDPNSFIIKSVTVKTDSQQSSSNGRMMNAASRRRLLAAPSMLAAISPSGNIPESDVPGMKYEVDEDWSIDPITLYNGVWEETIKDLPATDERGYKYLYYIQSVDEQNVPEGTRVSILSDGAYVLTSNGDTVLQVTNTVPNEPPRITIIKVDDNGKPLPGAQFQLITDDGTEIESFAIDSANASYTTTAGLEDGTYILNETGSPSGFSGMEGNIQFTVTNQAIVIDSMPESVTFDGTNYAFTIPNTPIDNGKLRIAKRWLDFYGNAASPGGPVNLKLVQMVQDRIPQRIVQVEFYYLDTVRDDPWVRVKQQVAIGRGTATVSWHWNQYTHIPISNISVEGPAAVSETGTDAFILSIPYTGKDTETIRVRVENSNYNPFDYVEGGNIGNIAWPNADGLEEGYVTTGGTKSVTLNAGNGWSQEFSFTNSDGLLSESSTELPATYDGRRCVYTILEEPVPGNYSVSYSSNNITGLGSDDTGVLTAYNRKNTTDIEVIKVDKLDNTIKLQDAEFTLNRLNLNEVGVQYLSTWNPIQATTDQNGRATFFDIPYGYYELRETKAPDGYLITDESTIYFKLTTEGITAVNKDESKSPTHWTDRHNDTSLIINNAGTMTIADDQKGKLEITKAVSEGDETYADGIVFSFNVTFSGEDEMFPFDAIVNGTVTSVTKDEPVEVSVTYSAESGAENKAVITDLPVGITYTVEEINKPTGWLDPVVTYGDQAGDESAIPTINANTTDSVTVTNTTEKTEITIQKNWNDGNNQDGIRPDITEYKAALHLYAGETDVTETFADNIEVAANGENAYTVTISNLPKYDHGSEINYKLTEDSIDGYTPDTTDAQGNNGRS